MCTQAIFIVIGPSSSGKSTFVENYVKSSTNFTSIPRKKILRDIHDVVTTRFMEKFLCSIKKLCGQMPKNIHELNLIKTCNMTKDKRDKFIDIKKKILAVSESEELNDFIKNETFKKYAEYVNKHIKCGMNLIIDESLIVSDKDIEIFNKHFNKKFKILTVLLFNSLHQLINKYIVRNKKFINTKSNSTLEFSKFDTMLKTEQTKGSSSSSFRNLHNIFKDYMKFYNIVPAQLNSIPNYIEKISPEYISKIIYSANKEHKKNKNILRKLNYNQDESYSNIFVPKIFDHLVNNKESAIVFSKIKYDLLLRSYDNNNHDDKAFSILELSKIERKDTELLITNFNDFLESFSIQ